MDRFLYATAHGQDPLVLAEEVATQLGMLPPEATLGFLYASDQLAGQLEQVVTRLSHLSPRVEWVGTLGIGLCASNLEFYDQPALVVMVTDIPRDHYRLLPLVESPDQIPEHLRAWCGERGFCFGLLHGDPTNPAVPEVIETLADTTTGFINGGLTSSNTMNWQLAGAVARGGVCGVLFGPEVAIATDHTQGCSPIGDKHEVTEARRNILMELDGRRALEVMKEEIGEVLSRDLTKIGGYIFLGLPIHGSDTGDYLVRNLLAIDTQQGYLAVGEYLDQQPQVMFCRRDGNTAREDMARMLGRLQQRLEGRPIRGGVYISCLGRGRHQFGEDAEELKAISAVLGEFPLVGFFANGELYNGRLYGYTGVLTLFL